MASRPLTWQNVQAPDYRGVTDNTRLAFDLFQRAGDTASQGIQDFGNSRIAEAGALYNRNIANGIDPNTGVNLNLLRTPDIVTGSNLATARLNQAGQQQKNIQDLAMGPLLVTEQSQKNVQDLAMGPLLQAQSRASTNSSNASAAFSAGSNARANALAPGALSLQGLAVDGAQNNFDQTVAVQQGRAIAADALNRTGGDLNATSDLIGNSGLAGSALVAALQHVRENVAAAPVSRGATGASRGAAAIAEAAPPPVLGSPSTGRPTQGQTEADRLRADVARANNLGLPNFTELNSSNDSFGTVLERATGKTGKFAYTPPTKDGEAFGVTRPRVSAALSQIIALDSVNINPAIAEALLNKFGQEDSSLLGNPNGKITLDMPGIKAAVQALKENTFSGNAASALALKTLEGDLTQTSSSLLEAQTALRQAQAFALSRPNVPPKMLDDAQRKVDRLQNRQDTLLETARGLNIQPARRAETSALTPATTQPATAALTQAARPTGPQNPNDQLPVFGLPTLPNIFEGRGQPPLDRGVEVLKRLPQPVSLKQITDSAFVLGLEPEALARAWASQSR